MTASATSDGQVGFGSLHCCFEASLRLSRVIPRSHCCSPCCCSLRLHSALIRAVAVAGEAGGNCRPCALGWFKDEIGPVDCVACPPHANTSALASTSDLACQVGLCVLQTALCLLVTGHTHSFMLACLPAVCAWFQRHGRRQLPPAMLRCDARDIVVAFAFWWQRSRLSARASPCRH